MLHLEILDAAKARIPELVTWATEKLKACHLPGGPEHFMQSVKQYLFRLIHSYS